MNKRICHNCGTIISFNEKDVIESKDKYDNGTVIYNYNVKCPKCGFFQCVSYTYIGQDGIEHKTL